MNLLWREALLSFKRTRALSALSVTTIAFALFVTGLFGLVALNLRGAIRDVAERVEIVRQLRARGEITLPSNLALEKRTNPFLRTSETSVKQKADERNGRDNRSGAEVFASLRAWKDKF